MKLQSKIILAVLVVLLALIVIPLLLTNFLTRNTQTPSDNLQDPPLVLPTDFETEPFKLEEGFVFNRAIGWELTNTDPERAVDRYRFDKVGVENATFTISFYDENESFESVIDARYGEGFIRDVEEVTVNGLDARRVTSAFLDQGDSSDVIVQVGEDTFISLYSIHLPEGESSIQTSAEINEMQMSFAPIDVDTEGEA